MWVKKVIYLSGHIFNYNTDDKDKDDAKEYFKDIQILNAEKTSLCTSFIMKVAEKVIYFPHDLQHLYKTKK